MIVYEFWLLQVLFLGFVCFVFWVGGVLCAWVLVLLFVDCLLFDFLTLGLSVGVGWFVIWFLREGVMLRLRLRDCYG